MLPLDELVLRCRAHRRQADVSELIRRLDNLIGGEVAAAARRWRVDRDDLRQQAIVGLLVALDKYDPDRGAFISLARVWIKDSLARYAERQTDVSRPNSKTELWIARHAGRLYRQHAERDPELLSRAICELIAAEGAAALGRRVDADRVEAAMALSMGRACGEEMARLEAPEDDAGADLSELLAAAIEGLPDRERRVIRLRFGAGEEIMSLDAIAAEIGQTREACRKVMLRGLAMLREALEVQGVSGAL